MVKESVSIMSRQYLIKIFYKEQIKYIKFCRKRKEGIVLKSLKLFDSRTM